MIGFLALDFALPPELVDDAAEVIAGLPVALDAQFVRLAQDQEVQHVGHVVVLQRERHARQRPRRHVHQPQLLQPVATISLFNQLFLSISKEVRLG